MIYAHRRAQVDQLNAVCQRLRANHGQLGPSAWWSGPLVRGRGRGGAGRQRPRPPGRGERHHRRHPRWTCPGGDTVRTLEDEPPRTVRLPRWYLDAPVRPGSRAASISPTPAPTCAPRPNRRRALLALDGAEDMQGGYVQLTQHPADRPVPDRRARTARARRGTPHPSREARAPEELLARVLSRDRGKTLATDTPDVVDVRRLSTRALRAERDRLAQLRADCPPDRSRELRLAAQRAGEAEQARQQARQDRQAAAEQLATLQSRLLRRGPPGRQGAAGAGRARAQDDDRAGGPGGRAAGSYCGGRSGGTWAGWKPTTSTCASASER